MNPNDTKTPGAPVTKTESPAAPAATPSAPAPADPAAAAATAGAVQPKKRGGRPRGAKDTTPRPSAKRRRKTTATSAAPAAATASAAQAATGAAGTFDGSAPGMDGAAPKAASASIPLTTMIEPEALAETAMTIGNEVLGLIASFRYPPKIVADVVKLQKAEIDTLQPLLAEGLKSAQIKVDPMTAFALLGVITIGMHLLVAEKVMRAQRREEETEVRAPPPATSSPSPAVVVDSAAARAGVA